jgi:hypothetical protein
MKIRHSFIYLWIPAIFLLFSNVSGQNPKFLIPIDSTVVDGDYPPFNTVQPGDTVFIQAGSRGYLLIRDFFGTTDHPVTFINYQGTVSIISIFNYGIAVANCRFVRLTGTGDAGTLYGINISHVSNGPGIICTELTSDYELDHLRVNATLNAGIYAKSEPDCLFNSTREKFTQYNTFIHDNGIENTGTEGIDLGSTFYKGETIHCNGHDTLVYPALLSGVRVYNNLIKSTGFAAIRVSSASVDCRVYNNSIFSDSQAGDSLKMSGIWLGPGTKADCYNNSIKTGKGDGIDDHGLGGNRIFNNLIIDAGTDYFPGDQTKKRFGILVTDASVQSDSSFRILFNDIIRPKADGVRFESVLSKNNLVVSNVIIDPGDYPSEGVTSYVEVEDPASEVEISNNYFRLDTLNAGFVNGSYELKAGSPLIDAGYFDAEGVDFDLLNLPRPQGATYDIGAYEYQGSATGIQNTLFAKSSRAYPNPASERMTIEYNLPGTSVVYLDIYNTTGTRIYSEVQSAAPEGSRLIRVDVMNFPSGVYMFTLRSGSEIATGKMIKM